ncbi:MAG TPA: CocE/NonD family hydrolase, partial [Longimicrobiaceae bacterium]
MTSLVAGVRPRILPRLVVAARDGVELCTDVYLPQTGAASPTVVVRTPYGRNHPFLMNLGRRLSDGGLSFLVQDCRGRYSSGGRYDLGLEDGDTHDTLAWLGEQEWSTGSVALLGVSVA